MYMTMFLLNNTSSWCSNQDLNTRLFLSFALDPGEVFYLAVTHLKVKVAFCRIFVGCLIATWCSVLGLGIALQSFTLFQGSVYNNANLWRNCRNPYLFCHNYLKIFFGV